MSKKQTRKTARSFYYVTPGNTRNFYIPKGLLCVRTKGEARIDGKLVVNPWVLHETPKQYLNDEEFLKYARTYGIIIGEENLEPVRNVKKVEFDRELLALCATEDTGTGSDCKGVPAEVVLKWIKGQECDYYTKYTPARVLSQWNEQFHIEAKSVEDFAAEHLENVHWEMYKALDKSCFGLACFDFGRFWSGTLRYDYGYIEHNGRLFFYSLHWN